MRTTNTKKTVLGLAMLLLAAFPAASAAQDAPEEAYYRALSDFFQVPRDEVAILADWNLPPQEMAVVLFMAERTGVSGEALVALRRSGNGWADLARRYHLDASHFHVPLADGADPGPLADVYRQYRALPPREWRTLALEGADIVTLVNLRVIAQSLRIPAAEVLAEVGPDRSFVDVYAELLRGSSGRPGA